MGWLEFSVGMVGNIAWPITVLIAVKAFAAPISASIARVRSAKLSKDGLHVDLEPLQRVLENKASPQERKEVQLQSVVDSHVNANGSFTLYSNRTIVSRVKLDLGPMTSSRQVVFPVSMLNEVTSVQVVGEVSIKVTSLSNSGCVISYDAESKSRSVELIVSGL